MSSRLGDVINISVFGQSHSTGIGVVIDGLPAGFKPDFEALKAFMLRRSPGLSPLSSPRREPDEFEILAGLYNGRLCGAPLCCVIRNADQRPSDYDAILKTPRPGHADYPASIKYDGYNDPRGGGHLSGRLTAPLCFAGGLAKQLLEKKGVSVAAHISRVGDICDAPFNAVEPEIDALDDAQFRVLDAARGEAMRKAIESARESGDSISGEIECAIVGLPVGVGEPMFDGLESVISRAVFAIPAVKGIQFGKTEVFGSLNNDEFKVENGVIRTKTNSCGGILGGISNGMPVVFSVTVKPTPSIAKLQQTVDLDGMKSAAIEIKGRHDPCIAPRAAVAVEAAAALAVCDLYMKRSGEKWN